MTCWPRPTVTESQPQSSPAPPRPSPTTTTELLHARKPNNPLPPIPPTSPLLLLPTEIRETILHFALSHPNPSLSILPVSHQLAMESHPLLYQRPIAMPSQSALFDWISNSNPPNLRQVKTLSLQLTDIDLSPLLAPTATTANPSLTAWTLYDAETTSLDAALRALPNLQDFTIVPPRTIHSQLLRGMYLSLLALIPRHYPTLRLLVIHDNDAILDAVTALQRLPQVTFKEPPPATRRGLSGSRERLGFESVKGGKLREVSPRVKCEYEDRGNAFLDLEEVRVRLARSYVEP